MDIYPSFAQPTDLNEILMVDKLKEHCLPP
jgi:hypothetical protein